MNGPAPLSVGQVSVLLAECARVLETEPGHDFSGVLRAVRAGSRQVLRPQDPVQLARAILRQIHGLGEFDEFDLVGQLDAWARRQRLNSPDAFADMLRHTIGVLELHLPPRGRRAFASTRAHGS